MRRYLQRPLSDWYQILSDFVILFFIIMFIIHLLKTLRFIFNWRIILYNIMLVSAIHQHESAIGIPMSPHSWTSFPPSTSSHPSRLLQSPGLSSLSHTANSHWLSILYTVLYMFHVTLSILKTLMESSPSASSPPQASPLLVNLANVP